VETPFTFSPNIQPVTLPLQGQETTGGLATIVGWGSVNIYQRIEIYVKKQNYVKIGPT
jgi:hypothetical protein